MKKRIIVLLTTSMLCLTFVPKIVAQEVNVKKNVAAESATGFETPEECVEAYMSYLSACDVDGMLSVAAIDQMAGNASLKEMCARNGFWDVNSGLYFEGTDELSINMNRLAVQGAMAKRIYYMIRTFSGNPMERANNAFKQDELPDSANAYVDSFYADDMQAVLSSISVEAIYSAEDIVRKLKPDQASEILDRYTNSYAGNREFMEYLHADDITELCVAFHTEADGRQALLFFSLVEYDGRWFINPLHNSLTSILLGVSAASGGLLLL